MPSSRQEDAGAGSKKTIVSFPVAVLTLLRIVVLPVYAARPMKATVMLFADWPRKDTDPLPEMSPVNRTVPDALFQMSSRADSPSRTRLCRSPFA